MSIENKVSRTMQRAFNLGFNDDKKRNLTTDTVFDSCDFYNLRNGYRKAVYAAYKAGKFARKFPND
jgi:hypothetical protein